MQRITSARSAWWKNLALTPKAFRMELSGRVKSTFLRGELVYDAGTTIGQARGQYLHRPGNA